MSTDLNTCSIMAQTATAAPPAEFKVFKNHYSALKNILSAQNLSQYFVSANLISFQDEEEICAAATSAKRATILLQRMASPLESGQSFYFHKMVDIMDGHGNIATRDLAHKMQADLAVERSKPKVTPSSQMSSAPVSEARQPLESAAMLQQQPVMPRVTRGVIAPTVTAAVMNPPVASIDSADVGMETVDLKEPSMKWLHNIVIPEIAYCWKTVADYLEYRIPKKKEIEERQHNDPTKCCAELLEDWLSTGNGVKPKTWSKLVSVLKEIKELKNASQTIEEKLIKAGLIRRGQ